MREPRTAKFRNRRFESSTVKTPEFMSFVRAFRADIKAQLAEGTELKVFLTGHFYVSGFVYRPATDRYVYFSISDVRFFPDDWRNNVLIRTAKSDRDFTGGINRSTCLLEFGENVERLLA